ncbi:MAG TPA: transglycosylase SLT domain-containing protein, partial [Candidatus Dormibacteraeota bacterium]|nr:transglycosylase SLT domain-containing protein [Candidatus Dormibacteraeota bacterium]
LVRLPARFRGFAGGLAALAVSPALAIGTGGASVSGIADGSGAAIVISGDQSPVPASVVAATADPTAVPTPLPTRTPLPTLRPTPTPAPQSPKAVAIIQVTPRVSAGTLQAIIAAAAARYGVSYSWMMKIAYCESGLNPRAVNPSGPFVGLFQFWGPTFRSHGGTNIWDPTQQANIAADMLAHGQASAWACA